MLQVEDLDGLLLLKATLTGIQGRDTTGPVALDTGAGFLALDAGLARLLGLADSTEFAGAIEFADRALPRLVVGSLQLDQVSPVLTIDAEIVRRVSDRPVLGLLGQQPLAHWALSLDYSRQIVALIPVAMPAESGSPTSSEAEAPVDTNHVRESRQALARVIGPAAQPVPFRLAGDGKILLRARVSDPDPPRFSRALTLILDTGATKCVLFEDSIAGFAPGAARWRALSGLSAPTLIGTSDARIAMVPAIDLETGGIPLRCERVDVAVLRSDLSAALSRVAGTTVHGLLGASFLRRYRVTIDFPHRVVWFEPPSSHRGERPLEYSHVGVQIERKEGALQVVAIAWGTPAARAGVRIGDQITAVNGVPVTGLDLTAVSRKLEGPPGTRVTLTVRRAGSARSFVMVRRRLL